MFEQTISKQTRSNLEILSSADFIKKFYLAGGTAAALQLGHRISEDLDFFSEKEFLPDNLIESLRSSGELIIDKKLPDTLLGGFNETKISFFHYPYPMLYEFSSFLSVDLASLVDIACMKIDTVASRGLKRDFVDLYFIMENRNYKLGQLLTFFQEKYSGVKYNLNHIKKSLIYFDETNGDPDPNILMSNYSWQKIKEFFIAEVKNLE